MSKITYHKNFRQHEAIVKAKRMLNKIEKQFGGFQGTFYCNIQLTGIDSIDMREVKSYIERHLKELKKKIEKQLFKNEKLVNGDWNEEYDEGFYIPPFKEELEIIEALNQVHLFIAQNYPELEIKKTAEHFFVETSPKGKYNEAKAHFEKNPVYGFCQEYFTVPENGERRKLFPITLSEHDFINAKSVYAEYI